MANRSAAARASRADLALAVLRLVIGVVFVLHGAQKVFTFGYAGVSGSFAQMGVPMPAIAAAFAMAAEFLGGIALILGVGTRVAAALIACTMVGAIAFAKLKNGFFAPKGYEFELTLLAAAVALAIGGGGAASIDGALARRRFVGERRY